MQRKNSRCLVVVLLLLIPSVSAIEITEIMYDVEGTDEGYEWIEVYNDGDDINFCEYRFYEAETNHKLTSADCTLEAGDYAIIADVAANLDFSCNTFDSSWQSLSNTGEEICIHDSEGNSLDCVSYSSDSGAKGNGKSLQLVDGDWLAQEPSPCDEFEEIEEVIEEPEQEIEEQQEVIEEQDVIEEIKKEARSHKSKETVEESIEEEIVYSAKSESSLKISYFILLFISIALNAFFVIYILKQKAL